MNLLHLRYFHEVAKLKSFSRAARSLRVSQPALSQMVALLEESLGKRLLERSTRHVELTVAGRVLYGSATRIFDEVRVAEERLAGGVHKLTGDWGLGLSDNLAHYFAPKVLIAFKRAHPDLMVHVFAGNSQLIKEELIADRSQLGLFYAAPKQTEQLQSREIGRTEFWIVSHPEFARKGRLNLETLRQGQIPRIESRHRDYSEGFPAHFHSRRIGLTHAPWLEVNSHEVKKQLVLEGAGYALLIRESVQDAVRTKKLLRIRSPEPLTAPVYAVWKKGRQMSEVSQRFLDAWKSRSGLHL